MSKHKVKIRKVRRVFDDLDGVTAWPYWELTCIGHYKQDPFYFNSWQDAMDFLPEHFELWSDKLVKGQ